MSVGRKHNAAVIGSLALLCSLVFADWTQLTSGTPRDLNSVAFPEGTQVGYAVGAGGTIVKTTDGGANWTPQVSGTPNGLNSVYFVDNSTGYAVGATGTGLKTTDGGATWNSMSVGASQDLRAVQFVGGAGYTCSYQPTGGSTLYKTTDAGASWQPLGLPGAAARATCLCFASQSLGLVAGLGGYVVRTIDGGQSFEYLGPGTTQYFYGVAFARNSTTTAYIVGDTATIIKTADAGTYWSPMNAPYADVYRSVCAPVDASNAYAVGGGGEEGGMIVKNIGTSFWYHQNSGASTTLNSVCFPNGNDTGYVVGVGGVILKTTDGGGTVGVGGGSERVVTRAAVRVVSNPSRHGIALHADANVAVSVIDVSGRVVMSQAATKGRNFLPLRKAGVYVVKAGTETAEAVVTD